MSNAAFRALVEDGDGGDRQLQQCHGGHPPHGDRLHAVRRPGPVLTVVVDTPARIRRWFEIVDELTDQTGLVTCAMVPAFRTGERDDACGCPACRRATPEAGRGERAAAGGRAARAAPS